NMAAGFKATSGPRRESAMIEGELVAKSTGVPSSFKVGDRVVHLKFGNGDVVEVDGNKLSVDFDKGGRKRVVDSFIERAWGGGASSGHERHMNIRCIGHSAPVSYKCPHYHAGLCRAEP